MSKKAYHNQQVASEMAAWGVVDRWIRSGPTTHEHVVSIQPVVSPMGHPMTAILLDIVNGDQTLCTVRPVGFYDMRSVQQAMDDAENIGRHVGVRARVSTPDKGWVDFFDPDGGHVVRPTIIIPKA